MSSEFQLQRIRTTNIPDLYLDPPLQLTTMEGECEKIGLSICNWQYSLAAVVVVVVDVLVDAITELMLNLHLVQLVLSNP